MATIDAQDDARGGPREVSIYDPDGRDLGFAIRLGPAPSEPEPDDESGLKTLASRITGWSSLKVDGEAYTFSKARTLGLLQRFHWIVPQLADEPAKTETVA